MELANYFFHIDKFFFEYLSFLSNSNIMYRFFFYKNVEKFFRFITKFGEGYFELLLITVFLSILLHNKKRFYILKKYILAIFFTLISTQIVVNLLKLSFGRARPSITANPNQFYGVLSLMKNRLLFEGDYASFPSGHTITIWGTVWILSFYVKNKTVKALLFILGALVGISRIYLGYHWSTDVVASIIISYFVARYIYNKINLSRKVS